MSNHATVTFEVKTWDEKPYQEFGGKAKLTRASVTKAFRGDIEGEGTLEYLMAYADDGTAGFVGMEHIVGRIGNRSGSFVLQHSGSDDGSTSKVDLLVVSNSGTGDLHGLRGHGSSVLSRDQPHYAFTLDYDFA